MKICFLETMMYYVIKSIIDERSSIKNPTPRYGSMSFGCRQNLNKEVSENKEQRCLRHDLFPHHPTRRTSALPHFSRAKFNCLGRTALSLLAVKTSWRTQHSHISLSPRSHFLFLADSFFFVYNPKSIKSIMTDTNNTPAEIPPTTRRPVRSTMLGRVWNANYVLELALSPDTKQVPAELFQQCKGIVVMCQTKAGFLFTGHCGTGVMMAKYDKTNDDEEKGNEHNADEDEWSPPVAVYNGGYSFGLVAGYKQDNYLIFLMDNESLQDFADRPQSRIGVVGSCTLGRSGGEVERGMNKTFRGQDSITVLISKGAFTGMGIEIETFETCQASQNHEFYGNKATVNDILFEKGSVETPKESLIPDLQSKLRKLARGETWRPGDLDRSRSGHFYMLAQEAEKKAKE